MPTPSLRARWTSRPMPLRCSRRSAPLQPKPRRARETRAAVDVHIRKLVPEFIEYTFTKNAPYRNHWVDGGRVGNYGADCRLRTVANYWANTSDEVIYFMATRDADERTLNGSNSYVIHFPADKLPESVIDAFWSVILVGIPDYRVGPNPLNRFNINNFSPLRKETDGSLKLAIGPKPIPGVAESNWLPSASRFRLLRSTGLDRSCGALTAAPMAFIIFGSAVAYYAVG